MKVYVYSQSTGRIGVVQRDVETDKHGNPISADYWLFCEGDEDEIIEFALRKIDAYKGFSRERYSVDTAQMVLAHLGIEYYSQDDRWGGTAKFPTIDAALNAAILTLNMEDAEEAEEFIRATNWI